MNTRAMLDKLAAANIWIFKDRATGLWVIRDRKARRDLAHESTRRDAFTVGCRIVQALGL